MPFTWLLNRFRRKSTMNSTTQREDGVLDMGSPQQMVGHSGFTRHAGGGECSTCHQVFASLMPDGKCAAHSQVTITGQPLGKPDSCDSGCHRK